MRVRGDRARRADPLILPEVLGVAHEPHVTEAVGVRSVDDIVEDAADVGAVHQRSGVGREDQQSAFQRAHVGRRGLDVGRLHGVGGRWNRAWRDRRGLIRIGRREREGHAEVDQKRDERSACLIDGDAHRLDRAARVEVRAVQQLAGVLIDLRHVYDAVRREVLAEDVASSREVEGPGQTRDVGVAPTVHGDGHRVVAAVSAQERGVGERSVARDLTDERIGKSQEATAGVHAGSRDEAVIDGRVHDARSRDGAHEVGAAFVVHIEAAKRDVDRGALQVLRSRLNGEAGRRVVHAVQPRGHRVGNRGQLVDSAGSGEHQFDGICRGWIVLRNDLEADQRVEAGHRAKDVGLGGQRVQHRRIRLLEANGEDGGLGRDHILGVGREVVAEHRQLRLGARERSEEDDLHPTDGKRSRGKHVSDDDSRQGLERSLNVRPARVVSEGVRHIANEAERVCAAARYRSSVAIGGDELAGERINDDRARESRGINDESGLRFEPHVARKPNHHRQTGIGSICERTSLNAGFAVDRAERIQRVLDLRHGCVEGDRRRRLALERQRERTGGDCGGRELLRDAVRSERDEVVGGHAGAVDFERASGLDIDAERSAGKARAGDGNVAGQTRDAFESRLHHGRVRVVWERDGFAAKGQVECATRGRAVTLQDEHVAAEVAGEVERIGDTGHPDIAERVDLDELADFGARARDVGRIVVAVGVALQLGHEGVHRTLKVEGVGSLNRREIGRLGVTGEVDAGGVADHGANVVETAVATVVAAVDERVDDEGARAVELADGDGHRSVGLLLEPCGNDLSLAVHHLVGEQTRLANLALERIQDQIALGVDADRLGAVELHPDDGGIDAGLQDEVVAGLAAVEIAAERDPGIDVLRDDFGEAARGLAVARLIGAQEVGHAANDLAAFGSRIESAHEVHANHLARLGAGAVHKVVEDQSVLGHPVVEPGCAAEELNSLGPLALVLHEPSLLSLGKSRQFSLSRRSGLVLLVGLGHRSGPSGGCQHGGCNNPAKGSQRSSNTGH